MEKFEFMSGPDSMVAELRRKRISFHGKGPRGGWVGGPTISAETMDKLSDMIAEAKGWPYLCKGCGRAEDDCSADPCEKVIQDRES